ncbi:FecR family protein [Aquimarina gracilis]|uniref:FecR family protein n=1 Tax=Aquimarina gracilis TaxID=874422 RepID=A0ABU5ZYR0_9FLAO|nr:FecR family protein [Aquimarina gracilis]MEB3347049.1 FecR family protein [Aquimarina gracilis]
MRDDKKDNIFLSRWINGELSEEELREFQSHPEYEHYVKIKAGADALDLRRYDIEEQLISLKSKRSDKKSRGIIKLWPYFAAAASIAIILGLFLFGPNQSYTSDYGEKLIVTLPDGSEMTLNAKSIARFDKKNWKNNRTVTLEGEAFFKVKKGSKFTVITDNGDVSVLGTQFNVHSQNSLFEVNCFEGKVSVTNKNNKEILTAGKAYRNLGKTSEKWTFNAAGPSWLTNTSSFRSIPIRYVLKELEEQYNIQIKEEGLNLGYKYTGTFPNDNIEVALKTVFSTLDIEYTLSQDGKTVVLEK